CELKQPPRSRAIRNLAAKRRSRRAGAKSAMTQKSAIRNLKSAIAVPIRAAIVIVLTSASPTLASGRVSLRNCVAPDVFTTHEIVATLKRTIPADDAGKPPREISVIEITSRLARAHLDESQPGRVKVADLLLMQPAKV